MPKGKDIRMLCNKTSSGLNSSVWTPHLYLPIFESKLWAVERDTLMLYRGIGDMFFNFMLSEEVRYLCGVDITNEWREEE